jgi:hypothetical protein
MACKLEDDWLFFVLAGVARERRDEIGDTACLAQDGVWRAVEYLLGLEGEHVAEPAQSKQGRRNARGVIKSVRSVRADNE